MFNGGILLIVFLVIRVNSLNIIPGCVGSSGQRRKEPFNHARKYALREPIADRAVVAKAIHLANATVNPGLKLQLAAGWDRASALSNTIPVYIVSGSGLGNSETSFVPPGERCVFVVASGIERIRMRIKGYSSANLSVRLEEVLALTLLHEMGHLYYGDKGTGKGSTFSMSDLDIPQSKIQDPEIRADIFAVSHLRNATRSDGRGERFHAGLGLRICLSNVSFNLASQRLVGDFGGTTLNNPALFLDPADNIHPNFELRFLIMEYALSRQDGARKLLLDFLDRRKKALGGHDIKRYHLLDKEKVL